MRLRLPAPAALAPIALACAGLALPGCGDASADAPGGVSAGEAKALEDAAAMLDERRLPPGALPPEATTEAGPVEAKVETTPAPARPVAKPSAPPEVTVDMPPTPPIYD